MQRTRQVRLWLGMVVLAVRRLATTCESIALVWGGVEGGHGRAGTAKASSSHQTYASPSKRVGVLAGGVAGVGSSSGTDLESPVFVGGMNMPETLKSISG